MYKHANESPTVARKTGVARSDLHLPGLAQHRTTDRPPAVNNPGRVPSVLTPGSVVFNAAYNNDLVRPA